MEKWSLCRLCAGWFRQAGCSWLGLGWPRAVPGVLPCQEEWVPGGEDWSTCMWCLPVALATYGRTELGQGSLMCVYFLALLILESYLVRARKSTLLIMHSLPHVHAAVPHCLHTFSKLGSPVSGYHKALLVPPSLQAKGPCVHAAQWVHSAAPCIPAGPPGGRALCACALMLSSSCWS